jgi:hypothetical protein
MTKMFTELSLDSAIFVYGLLALALIFFVLGLWRRNWMIQGPTILTMIGILGTFWGVAQGLSEFDPENVKDGLPLLLSGLKTAFSASIVGVGAAVALKFLTPFTAGALNRRANVIENASVGDVVQAIIDLKTTIGGGGESTLISQIKLLRQDTNDRLDALQNAQTEALKQLSQMGSATLVEALQQVITDFNEKISEQFGDNFKQLNQAVGKLLDWQRQHIDHVEAISKALAKLITQSDSIVNNHGVMNSHAEKFTVVSNSLGQLIGGLENQKAQILNTIQTLGSVLEKSSNALPDIERNIVDVAKQMSSANLKSQEILNTSLKETSASLRQNLEAVLAETSRSQSEHSKKIAEHIGKSKEQIELLDAALTEELTKALEAFGKQLSALSEKFASDYTPLTEKLREIVQIANRVQMQ